MITNEDKGGKIWIFLPDSFIVNVIFDTDQFIALYATWQGISDLIVVVYAKCDYIPHKNLS